MQPGLGDPPLGVVFDGLLGADADEGPGPLDRRDAVDDRPDALGGEGPVLRDGNVSVDEAQLLGGAGVALHRQRVHHQRRKGALGQDLADADRRVEFRLGVLPVNPGEHLLRAEELDRRELPLLAADKYAVVGGDQPGPMREVLRRPIGRQRRQRGASRGPGARGRDCRRQGRGTLLPEGAPGGGRGADHDGPYRRRGADLCSAPLPRRRRGLAGGPRGADAGHTASRPVVFDGGGALRPGRPVGVGTGGPGEGAQPGAAPGLRVRYQGSGVTGRGRPRATGHSGWAARRGTARGPGHRRTMPSALCSPLHPHRREETRPSRRTKRITIFLTLGAGACAPPTWRRPPQKSSCGRPGAAGGHTASGPFTGSPRRGRGRPGAFGVFSTGVKRRHRVRQRRPRPLLPARAPPTRSRRRARPANEKMFAPLRLASATCVLAPSGRHFFLLQRPLCLKPSLHSAVAGVARPTMASTP